MLRYRAKDDALRPARLRWLWLAPPEEPGADGEGARRPARALRRMPEYAVPPLLFALALCSLVALAAAQGPWVIAVTLFSPVSSSLIVASIGLLLWLGRAIKRHHERVRTALIKRAQCPGCLYGLGGLEAGEDHLTRCPECGCAWDLRPKPAGKEIVVVEALAVGRDAPDAPSVR